MVLAAPVAQSPAEYLAWDEAMLDWAESGDGKESLWFWESRFPFVVIGYGQKAEREVHLAECDRRGVPILRRCSGGGAVVQGTGCLNYGLVLKIDTSGPLATVAKANAWIMDRQRRAMDSLLGTCVAVAGHTDLVLDGRKFSGNSQRRRQHHLLFHGTVLLNFDLLLMEELLAFPTKTPEYRASRTHREFVINTGLSRTAVEAAISTEWNATMESIAPPSERIRMLVETKYSRPEWNRSE